ncbi:MAG: hypothetical protein JWN99_1138 [Ilumatobacteraceae bacterium]|nr:hypothetical protein [Ilumatobacteraceae bacterium]
MTDDANKLLRIYLEDHYAGATAGAARARRLADAEKDSADAAALATFADDVATDREQLATAMNALGIPTSRIKNELATIGEKLGALKPNGYVLNRSPLSTVVEIEAMQMAVRGKRSLWESLQAAPALAAMDLAMLAQRADDQLAVLDGLHRTRVQSAFH